MTFSSLIAVYLFLGGTAAGTFVVAAGIDLLFPVLDTRLATMPGVPLGDEIRWPCKSSTLGGNMSPRRPDIVCNGAHRTRDGNPLPYCRPGTSARVLLPVHVPDGEFRIDWGLCPDVSDIVPGHRSGRCAAYLGRAGASSCAHRTGRRNPLRRCGHGLHRSSAEKRDGGRALAIGMASCSAPVLRALVRMRCGDVQCLRVRGCAGHSPLAARHRSGRLRLRRVRNAFGRRFSRLGFRWNGHRCGAPGNARGSGSTILGGFRGVRNSPACDDGSPVTGDREDSGRRLGSGGSRLRPDRRPLPRLVVVASGVQTAV